jgi:hypothetical protein
MRPGRQTENQQPSRSIAEGRNRFTPVFPIEKRPAFRDSDFAAVGNQSRAAFALYHLPIQRDKVSVAAYSGIEAFGWKH